MAINCEDRLRLIACVAMTGKRRSSEVYSITGYLESRTKPKMRHLHRGGPACRKLPLVVQQLLKDKTLGKLTILGVAMASRQVVARCQCGRYVQRPATLILYTQGQGCSHCSQPKA
jgi:hypothetical protein